MSFKYFHTSFKTLDFIHEVPFAVEKQSIFFEIDNIFHLH